MGATRLLVLLLAAPLAACATPSPPAPCQTGEQEQAAARMFVDAVIAEVLSAGVPQLEAPGTMKLEFYDVGEILDPSPDFPAPEISIVAGGGGAGMGGVLCFEDDEEEPGSGVDADKLVELIEGKLDDDREQGLVEISGGVLIVRQSRAAHARVLRLLTALHGQKAKAKKPARAGLDLATQARFGAGLGRPGMAVNALGQIIRDLRKKPFLTPQDEEAVFEAHAKLERLIHAPLELEPILIELVPPEEEP